MRIGILGGTFNPIHRGHIELSTKVYEKFSLDKILFMINKIPPHKDMVLNETDRLNLLKLSLRDYKHFSIEECELKKGGISYTYESLRYLKEIYKEDEIYLIIGSDSFINFHTWKNIESILKDASLIVYMRSYEDIAKCEELKEYYKKVYNGDINLLYDKIIDISSSLIRENITLNKDISPYVDSLVYSYIKDKNLYRR